MRDSANVATDPSLLDCDDRTPVISGHDAAKAGPKAKLFHGKGMWHRIFGLIHQLSTAGDDGPISRVHY